MSESTVKLRLQSSTRGFIALLAVFALSASLFVSFLRPGSARADTSPPVGTPTTVSADGLPTAQIGDGVVWAEAIVGNTVYAAGHFATARPAGVAPGKSQVARGNMLAFSLTTGVLNPTFKPVVSAQVMAMAKSPDGTRLYIGGDFTTVNGVSHSHIAAFDTATGALVATFKGTTNGQIAAITASATTVYVGGTFTKSGTTLRSNLAAFNATTGALLPWNPGTDASVSALTLSPDSSRVIVGGRFMMLGGTSRLGLGAVDLTAGTPTTWTAPPMHDYGLNSSFTSLTVDGSNIYGAGYNFAGNGGEGNFEGRFAITQTGKLVWIDDCHGDSYGVWHMNDVLYSVSHSHNCANQGAYPETDPRTWHHALASTDYATQTVLKNKQTGYHNFQGKPAPTQLDWYPSLAIGTFTGASQAGWTLVGNGTYLVIGGEFPRVNGLGQQGLVRFAMPSVAPNKRGPVVSTAYTPVASKASTSSVKLSFGTTWDMDNGTLAYNVLRDSGTVPIGSVSADSRFWTVPGPALTYVDSTAPIGSHTYKIKVTDPYGNAVTSPASNKVTVAATSTNAPPTASFTSSCTDLTCSFDGTGSSDTDGTIASYAWNFGDGKTATGSVPIHTFAAAGSYPVKLTVTDDDGATGVKTVTVTVPPTTTGPTGGSPTATFTSTCTTLTCTFDGSSSSDSSGMITGYAWTFGDGKTGTGVSVTHAYTAAGTYPVTLTVTDSLGATGTSTVSVTVSGATAPAAGTFAQDAFGRTTTNGLGTADIGGAWTTVAGPTRLSVVPGSARFTLPTAGTNTSAVLGATSSTKTTVASTFSMDKIATGGGAYFTLTGRRVDATHEYRATVRILSTGAITYYITKVVGTAETAVGSTKTLTGVTYTPGLVLAVTFQAIGTGSTALTLKVWVASKTQPAAPQISQTDSTAGLQSAGGIGLRAYLSSTSTSGPVVVSVKGIKAVAS